MKHLISLVMIASLSACGGGGDGEMEPGSNVIGSDNDPNTSFTGPEGIWTGTQFDAQTNARYDVTVFVTEDGELRVIGLGAKPQLIGNLTYNNKALGGGANYYAHVVNDPAALSFSTVSAVLEGNFTAQQNMNLSVSYLSTLTSELELAYDKDYEKGASLSTLHGTYSDNSIALTFSADQVDGQDNEGCVYAGTVSVPNSKRNLYELQLTVSNCGSLNGNYGGLASLNQSATTGKHLTYQISNANAAFNGYLAN